VESILEGVCAAVMTWEVFEAMNTSLAIVESLNTGRPVQVKNEEYKSQ
jgi:hypothetical protein